MLGQKGHKIQQPKNEYSKYRNHLYHSTWHRKRMKRYIKTLMVGLHTFPSFKSFKWEQLEMWDGSSHLEPFSKIVVSHLWSKFNCQYSGKILVKAFIFSKVSDWRPVAPLRMTSFIRVLLKIGTWVEEQV